MVLLDLESGEGNGNIRGRQGVGGYLLWYYRAGATLYIAKMILPYAVVTLIEAGNRWSCQLENLMFLGSYLPYSMCNWALRSVIRASALIRMTVVPTNLTLVKTLRTV